MAGHYQLSDTIDTAQKFIETLLSGKIETPHGELYFPKRDSNDYSAFCQPFRPVGLQGQNRLSVLRISGDQQFQCLNQPSLDWELKAAPTPYESLQELMFEYGLGALQQRKVQLRIMHPQVLEILM